MIAADTPTSVRIAPIPFFFPGRTTLLPRGMAEWEPGSEDDGDLDDLIDGPDDGRDADADRPKPAA